MNKTLKSIYNSRTKYSRIIFFILGTVGMIIAFMDINNTSSTRIMIASIISFYISASRSILPYVLGTY